MPAFPPYLVEPIWEQFTALLPEREVNHPLGCHHSRIPDRMVFEKLVQVLVLLWIVKKTRLIKKKVKAITNTSRQTKRGNILVLLNSKFSYRKESAPGRKAKERKKNSRE